MNWFKKTQHFLWPSLAVHELDPAIDPLRMTADEAKELEKQEAKIREDLRKVGSKEAVNEAAKNLTASETKRRDTIETKAGAIIQSAGIVTALFASVPALSGRTWSAQGCTRWMLVGLFVLTLVHLLMAVRMAVSVRSVGAVFLPSADEVVETAVGHVDDFPLECAFQEIVRAKRNEGMIGMKVNRLSAAEIYYGRGLVFFALTLFFALCIS